LIVIEVVGTPRPGGSKTARYNKKTGKAWTAPANEHTATWRSSVTDAAVKVRPAELLSGPLMVVYFFYFNRPKCHYNSKGVLKPSAPQHHTKMPDKTKLERSTEDALTGIVWRDDAQVCQGFSYKLYCHSGILEGAKIVVEEIET
jgi:Holliday junction resolvase RusA-like endonuclease